MPNLFRWLSLAAGCLAMLACTTVEPVANDPRTLKRELKTGDTVTVKRFTGNDLKFDVDKVDKDGLHASGVNVPFKDIREVDREETSWWRTGLIGLGVAGVAAIIIAASSHKSSGSGGGGGW